MTEQVATPNAPESAPAPAPPAPLPIDKGSEQTPPADTTATPPTHPDDVPDAPVWESFNSVELRDWAAAEGLVTAEEIAARAAEFDLIANSDPADIAILPDANDPNAVSAFLRERMTVPETPEGYALETIEGADPAMATEAGTWFQEAGVADWQAKIITEQQIAFATAQQKVLANEDRALAQLEDAELRKEWKDQYEPQRELGRRTLRTVLDAAGVDHSAALKFLSEGQGYAATMRVAALFGGRMDASKLLPDLDANTETNARASDPGNAMASRWYKD